MASPIKSEAPLHGRNRTQRREDRGVRGGASDRGALLSRPGFLNNKQKKIAIRTANAANASA